MSARNTSRRMLALVVSIGNQEPYFDCLHSAGHFALAAAQRALYPSQPQLASYRYGKKALSPHELAFVLVHDELEAPFGTVKIRNWESSHKGHNGVKSVKKSLDIPHAPNHLWSRITVGIGRPLERTPEVVSDYVLRKMSSYQQKTIDTEVGPKVIHCLRELEDEWGK
ncbi:hypothetical protein EKO27_g10681 [Xylaria grammica]|uniref:peptidyl-tRNA hydrolase n=1 Tax=Xylaria grammica TaxID=363999 RepID=A0A439CQJ1_9PEZI|nr:hypothetical protein EKO27_g10681 [Xylaria grammica]